MVRIIIVVSCYIATQMLSDIASLRIVLILGFSIDAGTLVYPITFTLRDLVHKTVGARVTRYLIFVAAGINILMAGLFWIVSQLPADPMVGPQTEFTTVLSPVWRIVFASILAEVVSELLDTEVYRLFVNRFKNKHQWGRVLLSNSLSVPLDSVLFVSIAFIGIFPAGIVWEIFIANILLKGLVTVLSVPLIYGVKENAAQEKTY